jgi:hypothetical protein
MPNDYFSHYSASREDDAQEKYRFQDEDVSRLTVNAFFSPQ